MKQRFRIKEEIRIRKWTDTEWHIPTKEYMENER